MKIVEIIMTDFKSKIIDDSDLAVINVETKRDNIHVSSKMSSIQNEIDKISNNVLELKDQYYMNKKQYNILFKKLCDINGYNNCVNINKKIQKQLVSISNDFSNNINSSFNEFNNDSLNIYGNIKSIEYYCDKTLKLIDIMNNDINIESNIYDYNRKEFNATLKVLKYQIKNVAPLLFNPNKITFDKYGDIGIIISKLYARVYNSEQSWKSNIDTKMDSSIYDTNNTGNNNTRSNNSDNFKTEISNILEKIRQKRKTKIKIYNEILKELSNILINKHPTNKSVKAFIQYTNERIKLNELKDEIKMKKFKLRFQSKYYETQCKHLRTNFLMAELKRESERIIQINLKNNTMYDNVNNIIYDTNVAQREINRLVYDI